MQFYQTGLILSTKAPIINFSYNSKSFKDINQFSFCFLALLFSSCQLAMFSFSFSLLEGRQTPLSNSKSKAHGKRDRPRVSKVDFYTSLACVIV